MINDMGVSSMMLVYGAFISLRSTLHHRSPKNDYSLFDFQLMVADEGVALLHPHDIRGVLPEWLDDIVPAFRHGDFKKGNDLLGHGIHYLATTLKDDAILMDSLDNDLEDDD